jgi:sugar lactone lactonase YvrE
MDQNGNLWVCQWDGSRVVCYSTNANAKEEKVLKLPVLRPTSCCFGGPEYRHLFITTATEGLSEKELMRYPHSGSVLIVELGVKGQPVPGFVMKGSSC